MGRLMLETPLRSAALGLLVVAAATLAISLSDRLARLVNRRAGADERGRLRGRFRIHTLTLVATALGLVVLSEVIQ
jgi:hypothetical protein